jgi:hypothetical protein
MIVIIQTCWYITVIPALERWRQKNCEFEASLGYISNIFEVCLSYIYIVKPCLKKEKRKEKILICVCLHMYECVCVYTNAYFSLLTCP